MDDAGRRIAPGGERTIPSSPRGEVVIRLPAGRPIGGRLLAPDGSGLPGVECRAGGISTWTRENGGFRFDRMADGEHRVEFRLPPDLIPADAEPTVLTAGKMDRIVGTRHRPTVRLTLVDPEGRPVAGARVGLATSDEEGIIEILLPAAAGDVPLLVEPPPDRPDLAPFRAVIALKDQTLSFPR